jgi:ferredoxin
MRVWIDQDLCTGDGLCVDHCHDVFTLLEDGIAYVVEDGQPLNDPGGSGSLAAVGPRHIDDVIRAAEVCPGECIFIEIDMQVDHSVEAEVDSRIAARIDLRDDLHDDEAA